MLMPLGFSARGRKGVADRVNWLLQHYSLISLSQLINPFVQWCAIDCICTFLQVITE